MFGTVVICISSISWISKHSALWRICPMDGYEQQQYFQSILNAYRWYLTLSRNVPAIDECHFSPCTTIPDVFNIRQHGAFAARLAPRGQLPRSCHLVSQGMCQYRQPPYRSTFRMLFLRDAHLIGLYLSLHLSRVFWAICSWWASDSANK